MRRIPFVHSVALQAIGTHKLSIPHILACFFFIIVILCLIHATIDQNNIAGPIPSEIGNLSVLRILHLDYNQLSGVIPSELDNLEKLQSVTLDRNNLTGNLTDIFCVNHNGINTIEADCSGASPKVECSCCLGCSPQ
mmetsp:Transcript_5309/g.14352  ORF Transcript_5309/g.14352 Transcript_5309/m.14352 type:complete len:137 (+) Transcript_5309:1181-1591(+)